MTGFHEEKVGATKKRNVAVEVTFDFLEIGEINFDNKLFDYANMRKNEKYSTVKEDNNKVGANQKLVFDNLIFR